MKKSKTTNDSFPVTESFIPAVIAPAPIRVQSNDPVAELLSQAVSNNASVEILERLFSLREKVKAEQAKEAFVESLANFQQEMPVIKKTKNVMNKDGQTVRYTFAPLDSIATQIKKPVAKNGFSYTWNTEKKEGQMIVTAKLTHKLGHFETSSLEIPIDSEGFMTAPQKVASAQTFAKRHTLCNVLGLSTGDEDTDATDVGKEKDALSPRAKIMFLLRRLKEETGDAIKIREAVLKLTSLELEEKSFADIISRLELIVFENENYEN